METSALSIVGVSHQIFAAEDVSGLVHAIVAATGTDRLLKSRPPAPVTAAMSAGALGGPARATMAQMQA
ncbi:hypothetical protein EJB05_14206 [Eragrostis curvula]|uniref:Uncharacterized protein n=1 Tax=Eragrostis curvula TaxID=38414 RepID=A0A5J9V2S1_9POAL|nr:hypothetical protein EJB05_21265 [Eragrostis curvula]TVU40733.1 hypothetical protein EJB05_14206 [Eragrostis curvula]